MTLLHRIFAASLVLTALSATPSFGSARQTPAKEGDLLVYYCQNLAVVTVRVLPRRVEVVMANRKTTLAEVPQPAPARFSDGTVTLSDLGELVRLEEPGAVYWCRVEPVEVPWQDARLRGVDFRAAGDPAWSLEIDSGVGVEFAAGEGAARVVAKFPPVELSAKESRMSLTTTSGPHTLAVVTEPRVCHYAGSTMTLSVTVTLDGKTYSGCGRRLASDLPGSK